MVKSKGWRSAESTEIVGARHRDVLDLKSAALLDGIHYDVKFDTLMQLSSICYKFIFEAGTEAIVCFCFEPASRQEMTVMASLYHLTGRDLLCGQSSSSTGLRAATQLMMEQLTRGASRGCF